MRSTLYIGFLLGLSTLGFSQSVSDRETEITTVVYRLFDGMRKGDSAMVHSTFSKRVTLASISVNKDGTTKLEQEHDEALQDFLNAVGSPHKDAWNEETWNYKVQIDGNFAQVWCEYAFFLGPKFSHCGVDAFHLAKINGGWKIFHLADTRQKENCKISDNVFPKNK